MEWHWSAAAVGAISCWLVGWWVPAWLRMVPEPESPLAGEGVAAKELYVDIAARRGLALRTSLGSGISAALVGGTLGWPISIVLIPLLPVAVMLAVIDLRTRLLPRIIVLPATAYLLSALALVSVFQAESENLIRGLIGLVVTRALFWVMWRVHAAGMGFGDVRLAALVGLALGYLGWSQLLVGVYAGFLLLGIPGFSYAVIKRDRGLLRIAVPFGPFMLGGALVGIVLGPLLAKSLGYA